LEEILKGKIKRGKMQDKEEDKGKKKERIRENGK
jgi:hypothetical protein